ncbi:MAG: hypothetical protein CM15mV69_700 [Caudoviricetes sp.]|nr:MAG: hypothetical protein CM15mV69_700 [Caudoviricetes sp.]
MKKNNYKLHRKSYIALYSFISTFRMFNDNEKPFGILFSMIIYWFCFFACTK